MTSPLRTSKNAFRGNCVKTCLRRFHLRLRFFPEDKCARDYYRDCDDCLDDFDNGDSGRGAKTRELARGFCDWCWKVEKRANYAEYWSASVIPEQQNEADYVQCKTGEEQS